MTHNSILILKIILFNKRLCILDSLNLNPLLPLFSFVPGKCGLLTILLCAVNLADLVLIGEDELALGLFHIIFEFVKDILVRY